MTALALAVDYDPTRDLRHREARAARELADWLAYLEAGNRAPVTLEAYEWTIARLLRMFPSKALAEFTDGDVLHCLNSFSRPQRRTRRAALNGFFKWAKRTRRIPENPCELLPEMRRQKQRYPEVFSDAEVAALTGLPLIDGALMQILFDAGLRKSEAQQLRVRDWKRETGEIVILQGKGSKDRVIPITRTLATRLEELVTLEGLNPPDYWWYSEHANQVVRRRLRRGPVGKNTYQHWWERCLMEAGVTYRKPHTTRHTFATRWLRRRGRLETLSMAMGHESIQTTKDLYGHLDMRDVRADLELVEAYED